jgi:hypothetical protein
MVKQYRIVAYGAFLQSRRFVIQRFVVVHVLLLSMFDIRSFVFRRFVCAPYLWVNPTLRCNCE